MQLPHDQTAFEAEMTKALPVLRGREALYFAKGPDRDYVHPEAQLAYLGFKLGGNYACDKIKELSNETATR